MKHIGLAVAFVAILLSATAAFGRTPPCPPGLQGFTCRHHPAPRCAWYEFWCSESVYRNPNLSPVTKRKLYEHDPSVCHCDECRRMRLAAGVEYMGLDKEYRQLYKVPPRPRVYVPTPPPLTAPARPPVYTPFVQKVWCSSLSRIVPETACPDK